MKEKISIDQEKKLKKVVRCVLNALTTLILIATAFIAGWFGRWGALGKNKQALLEAIDTARDKYFEEVDEDALFEELFKAFKFDSYSEFYTAEAYQAITATRDGNNLDAGFRIYSEKSALIIYDVLAGSSAEQAGIEEEMYLFKFGKTEADLKTKTSETDLQGKTKAEWEALTAEDYFTFVSNLKKNEKYLVVCGSSENVSEAKTYEVTNGDKGAGISLNRQRAMRVYQVTGNSPADDAGLQHGMYILGFGASESDLRVGTVTDLQNMISAIKPDKDNNVTFYLQCSFDREDSEAPVKAITMNVKKAYQASYCYYRDNESAYRFLTTDKGIVADKREDALEELDDKTAYVALTQFTGNAAKEFKECLEMMKTNRRSNLILDLRGNGGGYMDVFVEIASYLLKDANAGAQKVAYAAFRDGSKVSYSTKNNSYSNYFTDYSSVYILADEYTASASECLIGALVDYGTVRTGNIFLHEDAQGTARTYGKGIMQTYYDVGGGNKLKLTSAKIYWPKSGKSIHDVGVTPDDGAQAIQAPLLPTASDAFLLEAIERIQRVTTTPDTPSASV